MNLLRDLQRRLDFTMLFVAHDLSVVEHLCDRVAVMYLGRIVELGTRDDVFVRPHHPYTKALLSAVPVPDPTVGRARRRIVLQGDLPSPARPPDGCRFHTRCPSARDRCRIEVPELRFVRAGHLAACHFAEELASPSSGGSGGASGGISASVALP